MRLLGRVSDDVLTELFLSRDVVVLPSTSRLEAFGIVLLEGMAAGCVSVVSDLPGLRDVASATGRVVRPGHAGDLRSALLALADEPSVARDLQERSRVRAAGYTWGATIDAYKRVFCDVLVKGGTRLGRRGWIAARVD